MWQLARSQDGLEIKAAAFQRLRMERDIGSYWSFILITCLQSSYFWHIVLDKYVIRIDFIFWGTFNVAPGTVQSHMACLLIWQICSRNLKVGFPWQEACRGGLCGEGAGCCWQIKHWRFLLGCKYDSTFTGDLKNTEQTYIQFYYRLVVF